MRIGWTEPARWDLLEIVLYLVQDNPYAARNLQAHNASVTLLQDNPHLGRPGRIDGTRELVMGNNPYVLPYRVRQDRIDILAVYHRARKWSASFPLL